ncbi:MAG TPA: RDD family protein [Candidatus Nitrosocosmicus sp.]|nr:RDD family protein [Candidatus Nitrosocosmicus sp.]
MSLVRAGFFRRLAAGLLDTLLGLVLFVLSAMWLVLGIWALRGLPRDTPTLLLLYAGVLGLGVGLHLIYHVVLLGGCGQTVGRMALGIAVVRADGGPPGYRRALLRSLGNLLTALTLGLAGLVALFNREGRDLADLFSGTRVVRVR